MNGRPIPPPASELGAALLTVLLLVAVMAVVSAGAVERLTLATRLAAGNAIAGQSRQAQMAVEALAVRQIAALTAASTGQTMPGGAWQREPVTLPLPGGGVAQVRISDGGNCFNLNSLVSDSASGAVVQRPLAIEQFAALMEAVGIPRQQGTPIAFAAADWIDADSAAAAGGGDEDARYLAAERPYRAANQPMTDAVELRQVDGVTPPLWARIAPWVCALPTHDLSPVNPNTLSGEQAPLLMMLVPGRIDPARARAVIAARPAAGFGRIERFWTVMAAAGATPPADTAAQIRLTTRWFRLHTRITIGDGETGWASLVDAGDGAGVPARLVRRTAMAED